MPAVIKNFIITDGLDVGTTGSFGTSVVIGTGATVGNSTVNTAITAATIRTGNSSVFSVINATSANVGTLNVRGGAALASSLTVDGAFVLNNTLAAGNSTITGFLTTTSTASVGGNLNVTGTVNAVGSAVFNNTLSAGNTTITGFVNVISSAQISGLVTVANNLVVTGNLTVTGTTTYVNTTIMNIADNIITLNADVVGAPSENAGIEINRGSSANSVLRWNETSDTWELTNDGTTFGRIHSKLQDVVLGTDTSGAYVSTINQGTGVTVSNSGSEAAVVTISIGQPIGTTDNVTFANVVAARATFTGPTTFNSNAVFAGAIVANGTMGTAGQALVSNGTSVYWGASAGTINTGNGLTGGPITTTGTISVLANTGIVANSTGLFVNPTYISTITSNNATFAYGKAEGSLNVNSATYATYLAGANGAQYLRSDTNTTYQNGILSVYMGDGVLGSNTSATNTVQVFQANSTTGDAFITFRASNRYAFHFGLDATTSDLFVGGWSWGPNKHKVWHAGNQGAASGLDADLLDGQHGSYYAAASSLGNYVLKGGDTLTGRLTLSANGLGVAQKDNIAARIDSGFFQTDTATTAEGWPETTNNWYHLLSSTHGNSASYYSMQLAGSFYDSNALYYRATNNDGSAPWFKIWHAGNDGAGSGLDADLLDGQQGAYYQPAATAITTTNIGSQTVLAANSASFVPWTGVVSRPTNLSSFTNDSGFITTNGRAYGRLANGSNYDVNWTAQSGQPSYVLGSNDGVNFYAWNPSVFNVNNASTANSVSALSNSIGYHVASLGVGTPAPGTTGEIRATNNITAYYSDERLKNIEGTIPNPLAKVKSLSGVYFRANDVAAKYGYTNKDRQVGVIAQEVHAILPEVIAPAPFDIGIRNLPNGTIEEYSVSGKEYMTVYYEKIVPLLIEAIKELSIQVDKLSGQVKELKG